MCDKNSYLGMVGRFMWLVYVTVPLEILSNIFGSKETEKYRLVENPDELGFSYERVNDE